MTTSREARWLAPRSEVESAYEDVEPHRDQTPTERLADLSRLSRMALRFLDRYPPEERTRLLMEQEPLAPEHEEAWLRLVRRSRAR